MPAQVWPARKDVLYQKKGEGCPTQPSWVVSDIKDHGFAWVILILCKSQLKDDASNGQKKTAFPSGYTLSGVCESGAGYIVGLLKVRQVLSKDQFNQQYGARMWEAWKGAVPASYAYNLVVDDDPSARIEFWPPLLLPVTELTSQGFWYLNSQDTISVIQDALQRMRKEGRT